MDGIVSRVVMGIIRHAVTGIAGGFVTKGLIDGNQAQTLVAGLMVAVGIGFSIYDKSQTQAKL